MKQNILVPGLFDQLRCWHEDFGFMPVSRGLINKLAHYRQEKTQVRGYVETLYAIAAEGSHAAHAYAYDFGDEPGEKAVLRAAPVELEAGLNDIAIGHETINDLDETEQAGLLAELNRHFSQDGWEFVCSEAGRWYLLLPPNDAPEHTEPLESALGSSLRQLVEGKHQLDWSRQLNEMQMLLYGSAVNQQREAQRKRVINSFWLWNTQAAMANDGQQTLKFIAGGGFEAQALAKALGIEWLPLGQHGAGQGLHIFDQLQQPAQINDPEAWQIAFDTLETVLLDLIEMSGQEITLTGTHGASWIQARPRFWKRLLPAKKSLLDLL